MSALSVALRLFVLISSLIDAAKILGVFPTPSISHQVVFRTLTQELVKRGHEVVVITPDPAFPNGGVPANLTEIDVHEISYKIWRETFIKQSQGKKSDSITQMEGAFELFSIILDRQLQHKDVQKIINKRNTETFDLLLLESCVRPALIFSHIFKAPVISISSLGGPPGNYDMMGASEHPVLYPSIIGFRTYNLTMLEKIKEIYNSYRFTRFLKKNAQFENEMLKNRFGPDTPDVEELVDNVDLLFLNSHPVFERIRPVPPSVVYMGGIHQKPFKALPADLKKYMDSSKHGVVYVSFGTNVDPKLLPADIVRTLVNVFSQLPYDVLFKWGDKELPGSSKNIRTEEWLPQSDLLRHENVKVFITQGGLQSTDEAITAGVPLIGIPMLADQWHNVENYVRHGIGLQLDMETLTEEQLTNAINKIIGDPNYRRNMIRMRTLIMDQPMSPLDRAMWWIEYLLRHGGAKHLKSPAANMSWWNYYEMDLVLTILMIFLFTLTVSIAALFLMNNYTKNSNIKVKTS